MVRPAVAGQRRATRERPQEGQRRHAVVPPPPRRAQRRGRADQRQRAGRRRLDARDRGAHHVAVDDGRGRAAGRVPLRPQEGREVRLVPDRERRRVGVAARDRLGEVRVGVHVHGLQPRRQEERDVDVQAQPTLPGERVQLVERGPGEDAPLGLDDVPPRGHPHPVDPGGAQVVQRGGDALRGSVQQLGVVLHDRDDPRGRRSGLWLSTPAPGKGECRHDQRRAPRSRADRPRVQIEHQRFEGRCDRRSLAHPACSRPARNG